VLAHSISVINVQSGVALHLMEEQPQQARIALAAINEASAEALREVRSVLSVLRGSGEQPPRTPTAGLARLDELVSSAMTAGVVVSLEVQGEQQPLPASVDLAAFRIVQESLTNIVRHASAREATVQLSYGQRELTIEITDDGLGGGAPPAPSAGFRALLDAQDGIEVVGEAADGRQAVEMARTLEPDIVLMDIRMPVLDGLAATREISLDGRLDHVRIVILTTFELDEYVFEAIRSGAAGFLVKDTKPGDLIEAVRVVAGGDALLSPSVTRRLVEEFAARAKEPPSSSALAELTERELEVMALAGGRTVRPRD
jgi:DNA-binding NarL/FixJ family response regulator